MQWIYYFTNSYFFYQYIYTLSQQIGNTNTLLSLQIIFLFNNMSVAFWLNTSICDHFFYVSDK